jgi:hypothetical protein
MATDFLFQGLGFGAPAHSARALACAGLVRQALQCTTGLSQLEHFVALIDIGDEGMPLITVGCNTQTPTSSRNKALKIHAALNAEMHRSTALKGTFSAAIDSHHQHSRQGKLKQPDSQNALTQVLHSTARAFGYTGATPTVTVNGTFSNVPMEDNDLGFPVSSFVAIPQDTLTKHLAIKLHNTTFNNVRWCARYVVHATNYEFLCRVC